MDKQYMDYGYIPNNDPYFTPPERVLVGESKGDIYMLTHDGEGKSLSFMNKAFISFTYGDKKIEDFGFIATTVNNRLDRENSPNSEDYVTEYKMIHGQYYWGSHYLAREMTITLATDGVTQKQLDDFKYWFQAGEIRELILSLHPNRAIMARVEGRPEINVLPFKKLDKIFINNEWQLVEIIEYKGEAQINFVMDEPFWYAKMNVLGQLVLRDGNTLLVDKWVTSNGEVIDVLDNDALRVIKLDMIPNVGMITDNSIYFSDIRVLSMLVKVTPYKYTLYNYTVGLAIGDDNQPIQGTPIVNDPDDIMYPLSGAVVGEITRPVLTFGSNNIVTQIPENSFRSNYTFSNDYKLLIKKVYLLLLPLLYIYTTYDYTHVKKGSVITLIDSNAGSNICIVEYNKSSNNLTYLLKNENYVHYLNSNNKTFTFENDSYIRICVSTLKSIWLSLDEEFSINKIMDVSLIVDLNQNLPSIGKNNSNLNYFYSGNASCYPVINFDTPIHFNSDGYIDTFSSNLLMHSNNKLYNTICLESNNCYELKITNPSIFSSYNQVISKLKSNEEKDIPSFIQELRNLISHAGVRNWIINCINIYYNNFNLAAMTLDSLAKKKLLQYMPYLFASIDESNTNIYNDLPPMISEEFQKIASTKIIRTDALCNRFEIKNDILLVTIPKINLPDSNFEIKVLAYSDLEQTRLLNGGLFYQWRYTTEEGLLNHKWYLLYEDEYINEEVENLEEKVSKWEGVASNTLKLNKVLSSDIGLYLQCVVSNNSTYKLSEIIQIKEFKDNLNISVDSTVINVDQNEMNVELQWQVSGSFLTGQLPLASDYEPKIYYQPNGTGNWILYDKDTEDYNNQIWQGRLLQSEITLNNKNLQTVTYTFMFDVRLDADRTQLEFLYKLNNTKFKLLVYKRTAISSILPTDLIFLNDEIYPSIQIKVNRMDIRSLNVTLTMRSPNQPSYSTINLNDNSAKGVVKGTSYIFDITNIYGCSELSTLISFEYKPSNKNTWTSITTGYDLNFTQNNSNITLSGTITNEGNNSIRNMWSKNNIIRLVFSSHNETMYYNFLPELKIYIFSSSEMNQDILRYQCQLATYTNNLHINEYTGNSITLSAYHENGLPGVVSEYSIFTYWEKSTDGIQFSKINGSDYNYLELSSTNTVGLDYDPSLSLDPIKLTDKGYYRCHITLRLMRPTAADDGSMFKDFDLTPQNSIYLDVINNIAITNKTCNLNNWKYYVSNNDMDDNNGNKYFVKNSNQNTTFTFQISYQLDNYIQEDVESYGWYYKPTNQLNIDGTHFSQGIIDRVETTSGLVRYILTFSKEYNNASTLYALLSNKTIYCIIEDRYRHEENSLNNAITINITRCSSRLVEISMTQAMIPNDLSYDWNWPVYKYSISSWKNKDANQMSAPFIKIPSQWSRDTPGRDNSNSISYSIVGNANKKQFTLSGTPKTRTLQADLSTNQYDGYLDNVAKYHKTNITTFNYTGYGADYITILSLNVSGYTKIKITAKVDFPELRNNNFYYGYRLIQNTTILVGLTLIIKKTTGYLINIDTDLNTNNSQFPVNLQLLIYYKESWPQTIGTILPIELPPNTNMVTYEIPNDPTTIWGNTYYKYIYKGLPEETITINQIKLIGVPDYTSTNNSNNNNNGGPVMLFASPKRRSMNFLQGNNNTTEYEPPLIRKTYPTQINCQTGLYTMLVSYNIIKWPNGILKDNIKNIVEDDPKSICYLSSLRYGESLTVIESIGDAILMNNLMFSLQNHFNELNKISSWSEEDKGLCYKLNYDGDISLLNFNMTYKNLYL